MHIIKKGKKDQRRWQWRFHWMIKSSFGYDLLSVARESVTYHSNR